MVSRVLLVDDNTEVLESLGELLGEDGFEVTTATSAAQAVELLRRTSFDAVITDIRMENPTAGFDVVEAAKRLPSEPVTLILTAFPMSAAAWRRSGAHACYLKAAPMEDMLQKLKDLLKKRSRNEPPP